MTLTVQEKADLFDYMASRLGEAKIRTNFGGSEWVYHEQGSSEQLAKSLREMQGYEKYHEEHKDDDNEDD